MENSNEKFSNMLHKKLDNIDINLNTNYGFDALQMKLSLQKFFHFHPRHFNVYYALIILSSLLFNVVLGVQYFRNQNAVEKRLMAMDEKLNNQHLAYQQLLQNKIIAIEPATIEEAEALPNKTTASKLPRKESSVINYKTKMVNAPKADASAADSTLSDAVKPTVDKIKAPTKILYIVKQDTIIEYDSIPLLPRRAKARKK